jgi:hypothetical protein
MPLTPASLPAIRTALKEYRQSVKATPTGLNDPDARAAAPGIHEKADALRRCLSPSDPDNKWNRSQDIEGSGLSPKIKSGLRDLWRALVEDIHDRTPPFGTEEHQEDRLTLLDDVKKLLGRTRGRTVTNGKRDDWVAKLRDRKLPVPWPEIFRRLTKVAPAKGWNVPNDARALSEAYRRWLKKERDRK